MAQYKVKDPAGNIRVLDGPDNASDEDIIKAAHATFGDGDAHVDAVTEHQSVLSQIGHGVANAAAGAIRGAGSIGATLLAPVDMASDALAGKGLSFDANRQRRADMDAALQNLGADTDSYAYKGGKIASEVAGTAGAGGLVGNGLRAVVPAAVARARALGVGQGAIDAAGAVARPVLTSIESGGMQTGLPPAGPLTNAVARGVQAIAVRGVGGAVTGAASSALVNPEDAGSGAVLGAVLPVGVQAAGAVARGVGNVVRGAIQDSGVGGGQAAGARDLLDALGAATPADRSAVIDQLRQAETLVPGASPTVAQALGTPQAGILQRVVHDSPGGEQLRDTIAQQHEARLAALERVAPTVATGKADAANDLGIAIQRRVIPEEKEVSQDIGRMYDNIDPNGTEAIPLPLAQMQDAVDKYLGRGTFGANNDAREALDTARGISAVPGSTARPDPLSAMTGVPFGNEGAWMRGLLDNQQPATWAEVNNLRSSIGEAAQKAKVGGDKQAAAALNAQKAAMNEAIGEHLSPDAQAAFLEANSSHAAKMDRFHNGPQGAIFQTAKNGQPALQGDEITRKFWGSRPGLADDVASFRKLVDDNPNMLGQFKSMITTEGAATADASGNLTSKFSKWVDQTLPGLRKAFDPDEVKTLENISADLKRHAAAVKAGTSLGGSNTYQNASNALSLGLLDSPMLNRAASMIPGVKYAAAPLLAGAQKYARNAKAERMAALLSDSNTAADAISTLDGPTKASILSALIDSPKNTVQAHPLASMAALQAAYRAQSGQ